ncbi:MAG: InlB B-repeat-containing protein [Clostridia bacterium]|nr:InlB B-repeat-containing protein [Clostridia bacterium]
MKRFIALLLSCVLSMAGFPYCSVVPANADDFEYNIGDSIVFGNYPQSLVSDSELIDKLNKEEKNWQSYGYYYTEWADYDRAGGKMHVDDFMQYADFFYGGKKYRAVKFSKYRPGDTTEWSDADHSNQDENGYLTDTIYYFLYDNLKWRVLDPSTNLILCETIIDSQAYTNYGYYDPNSFQYKNRSGKPTSDYYSSSIREWLLNDFFETAFTLAQQKKIQKTLIGKDDSATVYDNVFLLSESEASSLYSNGLSDKTGKTRSTDYAKCQGLYVYTADGRWDDPSLKGHSEYWKHLTDSSGNIGFLTYTSRGVRPACRLKELMPDGSYPSIPGEQFTVSYDANGGIGAPADQTKTEGTALTISTETPSKSFTLTYNVNGGSVSPTSKTLTCTFNNWNTKQDGSGTSYAPGAVYNDDANVTLYAQWTNPLAGTLATPTRSGYNFNGWFTAVSGGSKVTDASTISSDVTFYAHWTEIPKKAFTVKYDANGGIGAPADQTKTEGTALTISTETPSKSFTLTYDANGGSVSPTSKTLNCTFNNWNTVKEGSGMSYSSGASYTNDAAVTLYAQWTNPKAGTLATPTRNGYTFDGWFTAATSGSKVTDVSTVSADITYYAHWTEIPKKTYTVKYDANGGSGAPADQTKTEGTALTISTDKPTKSYTLTYNANGGSVSSSTKTVNCIFNHWNTAKNGSGMSYASGTSYTNDAAVTLYAQWTNPKVGTLATPTRNGCTFDGWYTAASGGSKVTDASTISADTTLYAHWTEIPKKTYTVKYDANGGSGAPADQTKTEGSALTISSTKPTKSFKITFNSNGGSVSPASKTVSCTFSNWNTAKNGSGTSYVSGANYTKDVAVILYAQWTNPKAGTLVTPTRSGYNFDGWYTAVSGGNKVTDASTISADTTLYAHWTEIPKKTYTVKYDANGGSGAPADQTKTERTALTISSTEPTKSFKITYNANGGSVSTASKTVSCTFNNWNTAKNGSGTSYASGASYTKDAVVTLYAQWVNPKAGTLATPSRSGYTFDGWHTAASGGSKVTDTTTISADTTIYAHWNKTTTIKPFIWGTDNWNFVNSSYTGDFSAGTYRSQIDNDYLRALARNLTNEEFQVIFYGTYYSYAWLDELFTGSCYGMSSTTLLAKEGLLPYSQYKSGATRLNQLNKPTASRKVSSLITYYQMLQVKDVIQQQYRSVPYRTNETNIKELLSLLDEHSTVLVGFKKNNWGAHAILAYGYEYGSYTYNGVTYQGCIKICDPNASKAYDASYNIYFNTQTYSWAIPAYRSSGISSANGAVFTYIGANVKAINQGGYLSGSSASSSTGYIARIDAAAISDNRSVSKMQKNAGGGYSMMNAAPDDIVEDYSYVLGNESKGTIGYNLKDGDAAYIVTQSDPVEMRLTMDYEDCYFAGSSAAGKSITFDKNGYVEVNGESSEFTISMTFNDDHPTDWFTVQVKGTGSNHASLQKDKEGYVITADDLTKTEVKTNNRTDSAEVQFSTEYKSVLIYEVDSTTIGIKVDTDNNGTYETVLKTDSVQNALGDVDNDGQITPADARLALRVSVKLEKEIVEGTAAYKAADVDKDGDVTPADARTILRVSVNLESF